MAEEKKINPKTNGNVQIQKNAAAGRAADGKDDEYSIPNEVNCSPEFPQGCISAD